MRELRRIETLLEEVRNLLSEQGEVSVAQISVLISHVSMLISQVDTLIAQRASERRGTWIYRILALIFGFTTLILSVLQFTNIGDRFTNTGDTNTGDQSQEIENQSPPIIISSSNIMDHLENEPMTDQRFKLLEANLDSVPSRLSLNQLGSYIQLFYPESWRLKVLRLLQPKITTSYSDNELEAFKKLFNRNKQREAVGLLPIRKR